MSRRPVQGRIRRVALLGAALVGCSPSPQDAFRDLAVPVLEARCASERCHGVGPAQSWPEAEGLFFAVDARGRIADVAGAREAARSRIVTTAPAVLSSLIRVPLPRAHGGGPHLGGALFTGPDDPALEDLAAWIAAEPEGTGGEDVELGPLEAQFGREVLPVLVERCGRAGCHGPTDIAFTAFPARPDPATGAFAPLDIRAAHEEVRKHLDLWGTTPARSRLIRKALGARDGGLAHRGGEGTFFPEAPTDRPLEAPGLQAILRWAEAERAALGVTGDRVPAGLLYVAGPPAPRAPFRIAPGPTGSDLYRAPWPPDGGDAENLTAALHPGEPVEIRDPALSHDAGRVAFAMRRAGEADFALYEIDLPDGASRRLSPEGATGSFVDPAYAPDGRVIAVWDGHGEPSADGAGAAPELVAVDPSSRTVERLTWTPAPEVEPAFFATGKTRGMLGFGTRRQGPDGPEAVLFRFPLCHDPDHHGEPEYHVQFGASLAPDAPVVARDLPDGRQILVVLETAGAEDDRGRLGVLDRAFGPALDDPASASVGGYRDPVRMLEVGPRWRDPAPLPDGRVLVAGDDPSRPGEDAIHLLELADGPEGPSVAGLEVVRSEPGRALRSPVPVVPRPPEDDDHPPAHDPSAPRGYLAIRDAAVLEMLYGDAAPAGERVLRQDLTAVRVLRPAGVGSEGLGRGPAATILDEVDLAADRSAWLEVPAGAPLLLQWLDDRGMAAGDQLDRWFYTDGDETVPNGTNPETYAHICAGCHGSLSGAPDDAAVPAPDAISAASITLSTHEMRDPRRPLDPQTVPANGSVVDYRGSIAPRFELECTGAGCHGGDAPAAELPLDGRPGTGPFPLGYERLLEDGYVDADGRSARRSVLVERLTGEEMEAPKPMTGACPPGGADPELVRRVVRWIETGAFYAVEGADAP